MKPSYVVTGLVAVSALGLGGCSDFSSLAEAEGFSKEAQDNGLHLMSQDLFDSCGSWSQYNKVFDDENKYPDIYYCTGDLATPVYLYKGAYALSLNHITDSKYFKSKGEDKSDVYVPETLDWGNELAYREGAYVSEIYEDPVARFDEALDETQAEGVLVTQDQIDAGEWVQSDEDPDVLVNTQDNTLLYMGAMFASMAMLNNSSYYNSHGAVTQGIAVPASYMNNNTTLGYSNGTYYSDKNNIKAREKDEKDNGTSGAFIAGGGSRGSVSSTASGIAVASTSAKTSTSAGKATTSGSSATIKGGAAKGSASTSARGSGGFSSGAKGGGAS